MHWIAPSGKDIASDTLEKRLWAAADQFRANSGLSAVQYFKQQLTTLNEELEVLNAQARNLEKTIATNVAEVLEA